jgi:hypothetical protein
MTIASEDDDGHPLDPFFIFAVICLVAPAAGYLAFYLLGYGARGGVLSIAMLAGLFGGPSALLAGLVAAIRFHVSRRIDSISFGIAWALGTALLVTLHPFAEFLKPAIEHWYLLAAFASAVGLGAAWLLIIAAWAYLKT